MIQVELSSSDIAIEPGGTAQLTVTVHNKQTYDDHLSLEIEGLDVEWYALPVPNLNIVAGGSQTTKALFKIPRSSDCRADAYPFVVRVRGLEAGESGFQQGILNVKPYHSLQLMINPRRASVGYFSKSASFEVSITNEGNHESQIDLFAADPDEATTFEFESTRIAVGAGHTVTVGLVVEPQTKPTLGSPRLYGFSVTGRLVDDAYVSSTAHAQLERHPMLSTAAAILCLAIVFGITGWNFFRPRPVLIRSFSATPTELVAGGTVRLSWHIENLGENAIIQPGNIVVTKGEGTHEVTLEEPTSFTLTATGGGDNKSRTVDIVVTPRPIKPAPRITSFTSTATRIHAGDPVTLTWTLQNANTVLLNPIGKQGEWPLFKSFEHRPEVTTVFDLSVKGEGGDSASKQLKVEVVPVTTSLANIASFKAKAATIEEGQKAILAWEVTGAVNLAIDNGGGSDLPAKGKAEVSPASSTTYTLTAVDNKGNQTTKTVTITVVPPGAQPADPITSGGGENTAPAPNR